MKVTIKEFSVDMEVKTRGIEFEVRDPQGSHLGDMVLTKTNLIWCPGRTDRNNGKKLSWAKFIQHMESL